MTTPVPWWAGPPCDSWDPKTAIPATSRLRKLMYNRAGGQVRSEEHARLCFAIRQLVWDRLNNWRGLVIARSNRENAEPLSEDHAADIITKLADQQSFAIMGRPPRRHVSWEDATDALGLCLPDPIAYRQAETRLRILWKAATNTDPPASANAEDLQVDNFHQRAELAEQAEGEQRRRAETAERRAEVAERHYEDQKSQLWTVIRTVPQFVEVCAAAAQNQKAELVEAIARLAAQLEYRGEHSFDVVTQARGAATVSVDPPFLQKPMYFKADPSRRAICRYLATHVALSDRSWPETVEAIGLNAEHLERTLTAQVALPRWPELVALTTALGGDLAFIRPFYDDTPTVDLTKASGSKSDSQFDQVVQNLPELRAMESAWLAEPTEERPRRTRRLWARWLSYRLEKRAERAQREQQRRQQKRQQRQQHDENPSQGRKDGKKKLTRDEKREGRVQRRLYSDY